MIDILIQYKELFYIGILNTLKITLLSIIFGSILSILLAYLLLSKYKLIRYFIRLFVDVFLSIPLLVLIIWLYYALPDLNQTLSFSSITVSVLALSLSLAAFMSEIIKSGINSVSKGQIDAAQTLGLNKFQIFRHILLPQVYYNTIRSILGQYITCYKFSSLASIIGVNEMLHISGNIIAQTYRPIEVYSILAFFYIITILPMIYISRRFEKTVLLGGTSQI